MSGQKDFSARSRALRASTAERLEAIVEAAERAAEGVIDDAEEQARAYLAEARELADREAQERLLPLAELTDTLLEEAAALRRQAERLQSAVEDAKARIEGGGSATAPEERRRHLVPVSPIANRDGERSFNGEKSPDGDGEGDAGNDDFAQLASERGGAPAGARLLATQMAVSGSSREEIDQRLRNGFGIEDTTPILDAILGPEE